MSSLILSGKQSRKFLLMVGLSTLLFGVVGLFFDLFDAARKYSAFC